MIRRRTCLFGLLVVVVLATNTTKALRPTPPTYPSINAVAWSKPAIHWADSVMSTLTEREKIAQLFIPHLVIKDDAAGRALLDKMVDQNGVGGILLGKGTILSYNALINRACDEAKVPPLVTLDGEWGPAMRLTDVTRFPYNMALGSIRDMELIEEYGREVARQCRALGITVDFAPVADVNSNPANPVIGYRSFGEDPERVAEAVAAFSRGLESGGVMAVAKHFPGHGDTSSDSHKTLPVVDHSRETLGDVDLVPFKKFIEEDFSGIMVGHLSVPSVDPSGTPASLSHTLTTSLLKESMGFKGLVFTDALAMKGASTGGNNCVAALKAGADMLLGSASPITDIDAVAAAVRSGNISREVIDQRCRKVLAYKYALGLDRPQRLKTAEEAKRLLAPANSSELRKRLAAATVTVLHDNAGLLPIEDFAGKRIAVVTLGAGQNDNFARTCREYGDVDLFAIPADGALSDATLAKLKKYDVVISLAVNDRQSSRSAFARLSTLPGLIGVFCMNPYKMANFGARLSDIPALVVSGDDTPEIRSAVAEAVFGGVGADGCMPVNLTGIARLGDGKHIRQERLNEEAVTPPSLEAGAGVPQLSREIDRIVSDAIAQKAFPGAQVIVAQKGKIIHNRNYGYTDYDRRNAVTDTTMFDLASMTKATATLCGLMKAYDEGLFKLDDPVSQYVPGMNRPDKRDITFTQLLHHTSGFPATINPVGIASVSNGKGKPRDIRPEIVSRHQSNEFDIAMADGLWVGEATLDSLMNRIHDVPLKSKTYRYSDLNFCILKEALENMTGVPLDQWVETEIFMPMGITHMTFNPLEAGHLRSNIAPTETDKDFRRQKIHGYVHDETAALSGGVQGNAGLFSDAFDVAQICQMLLDNGRYGGETIINPSTVRLFTTTSSRDGRRFLGFDRQPEDSPAPPSTYGHNGFTGTCFWVDPDNDIVIVFLSNRVNPSRTNPTFSRLKPRTAVIETVYKNLVK
ncbi:MAG: serine hydrolase [Clostridium sp.]|nr:serine hydrolase [Clostridium sp.]